MRGYEGMWKVYAEHMTVASEGAERILLIDTCGEGTGVAVGVGAEIVAEEALTQGGGAGGVSAEIVGAVERVLQQAGLRLAELDGVGVVSGPGSFTGVRVGLAAAKGLCEAAGVRMIAVSRLVVLGEAVGLGDGLVALDAGRGELYLYERRGGEAAREWLGEDAVARAAVAARRAVYVAEARVAEKIAGAVRRPLRVSDALRPMLRVLRESSEDKVLAEANYVRRESDIYARAGSRE